MSGEPDIDSALPAQEREALSRLAERLERERPVPSAAFRGELRRRLIHSSRSTRQAGAYRALAATYLSLGFMLLAVAGVGLAGVGPFGS